MNIQKYFEMLRNGEEEKARRYREKTIPSKLVKFFYLSDDIDNNEKRFYSLENGQIWFSCVTKLNDPYEFRGMRIDENELFEYGYTKDQVNQFRELLEFNDYGVCCFTANDVNYLPMWAYYSNNHEGFCVEYDVVKPSAIHEVFYEADRIQVGSLINEINIAGRQSLLLGRKTEECNRYL